MSPIIIAARLENNKPSCENLGNIQAKFSQNLVKIESKIFSEFQKNDHCASLPPQKNPMNLEVAVIV